jgi:hypothetical protein
MVVLLTVRVGIVPAKAVVVAAKDAAAMAARTKVRMLDFMVLPPLG